MRDQRPRFYYCIRYCLLVAAVFSLLVVITVPTTVMLVRRSEKVPKSDILLPLYVYPAPGAWDSLYESITANPTVNFTIVVNPHSGPGATLLPDANYTREIPALNAFPNVRTVGYVSTDYSKRDLTAVLSDVATYSNWAVNSSIPGLGVQGIFLDETPNQYDSASASFLAAANQAVKTAAGLSPLNLVIHNPGTIPDNRYFTLTTDITVIFEETFQTFGTLSPPSASLPKTVPRDRLACLMHSVPQDLDAQDLQGLVRKARSRYGWLFVTDLNEDYYARFSGRLDEYFGNMVG